MVKQLHHRRADKQDVWNDDPSGLALGHARLSIIDLSAHGDQPMVSPSGRYIIAYNGEIYNHLKIRKQLPQLIGEANLIWKPC